MISSPPSISLSELADYPLVIPGRPHANRMTVEHAHDLKESAEMHRRIYQAIRDRDAERAKMEMTRHLDMARQAQASEELPAGVLPSRVVGSVA